MVRMLCTGGVYRLGLGRLHEDQTFNEWRNGDEGGHLIVHWARTQQLVALSSAEAEFNAAVKAAQEGLAISHLEEEFGRWMRV